MKASIYLRITIILVALLLISLTAHAQPEQASTQSPPIQQPLIREGDFAVSLVSDFDLGTTDNEVEAEDILSSVGIAPRNGWIADYPVTPDVLGDIWQSVLDAVDSQTLPMSQDEASKRFQQAEADAGLGIRPYTSGETHEINPSSEYPQTSVINNYYYDQGPPIVTYYAPPPDYYYLYTWVPYPFWWYNFWFPGFFILNDFDRVVHYHHRAHVISNHFNDYRHHRAYRIDPLDRYRGKTYAGIGAPRKGHYISSGVKNGATSIFNRNRISPPPGFRTPGLRSGRVTHGAPPTGRTYRAPSTGRTYKAPSGTYRSPSPGRTYGGSSGGRYHGSPSGGRSFSAPSGGRSFGGQSGGRSSGGPSGGRMGSPVGGQRR
jgi:hypothetical protein